MKYKTIIKGEIQTGTYNQLVKLIANSGFIGFRIEKDITNKN